MRDIKLKIQQTEKNKNYLQSTWHEVYEEITMKDCTEPLFTYRFEIKNADPKVVIEKFDVKYKIILEEL